MAMSGGTDSSVAAAALIADGVDVVGVTLHLWDASGQDKVGRCCAPEDRDDARRVCDDLGIPHYVVDERESFLKDVVEPFVASYAEGTTPAPCVRCNQHVKLTKLVALADAFGASHVATGHYARLVRDEDGTMRLFAAVDRLKDQSYFLYGASQATLSRLMFPLGGRSKSDTRDLGRKLNVHNAEKPDSQELCFVPDGKIGDFVEKRTTNGSTAGRLLDADGTALAEHDGIHRFTVGQRKGLGLSGGPARYVLRILPDTGDVVVGDAEGLMSVNLRASEAVWTSGKPSGPFDGAVRIRHRHEPASARITPIGDDMFEAVFADPQRAITPGQAAVIYRGEEVVGGGFITANA